MDFIKRWFIFQWNALIIKIYYFSNKLIKNIPDTLLKSFITKHENTSHKLSKTIRQAQKLDSNRSLYSGRKKVNFFERKKFNKNKTRTRI